MSGYFIANFVTLFIIIIVPLVLLLIALVDILRSNFPSPNDKIMWVIIILFLPIIGPLLYFFIGKKQRV